MAGLDVKQFPIGNSGGKLKLREPIGTVRFVGSVDFVDNDSRYVIQNWYK